MSILIGGLRRTIVDSTTGDLIQAETLESAINHYKLQGFRKVIDFNTLDDSIFHLYMLKEDVYVCITQLNNDINFVEMDEDTFKTHVNDYFFSLLKLLENTFLSKLHNKKGILFFDMDQTIYDFTSDRLEHDEYDTTTWWSSIDGQYKLSKDKNEGNVDLEGINVKVLNYLKSLKDDYVLISNTAWWYHAINEISDMQGLFDFYGSHNGSYIEFDTNDGLLQVPTGENALFFYKRNTEEKYVNHINYYQKDIVSDILNELFPINGKAMINNIFYNFAQKKLSQDKFNKLKIIQFEDELTGADDLTDYVLLINHHSNTDDENDILVKRAHECYDNKSTKLSVVELGLESDGVMTWCLNNLKKRN